MKTVITVIFFALLVFVISGCSLPGISTEAGAQNEGTPQVINPQEGSESITEGGSGEEPANAESSPDEAVTKVRLVKVVLYFATKDNSALKEEEREIQVFDGAILKACVLALQKGPETEGLSGTIPEGTALKGISIKDKVATVDFSKEFEQADAAAGNISRLSVINTLTRINGVEKVRFHINGEDMTGSDGQSLGNLSPVALNEDGIPVSAN